MTDTLGESDREQKKITFYKQLNSGTYTAIRCLEKKLRKRNKNMETIQTKDYHEFVLQGEILLELKDLHSEAKQHKMRPTSLITIKKRQKKVQIMRQQWQEELFLINYEINNEGLRLDRIFDDTDALQEPQENAPEDAEENEPEDIYSDMPPLEEDLLYSDEIINALTSDNIQGRIALAEHLDNVIQVNDREAFLNNIIQYFNDIDPLNNNINNVNNNMDNNIFLA